MTKRASPTIEIKVDWADLDLFGHVNNVVFFRYIQSARVSYCEHVGLSSVNANQASFMVASCRCQFMRPVRYPAVLTIRSFVTWMKNTSFCLQHILIDENGNECAKAEDVLVVFDHMRREKVNLSEQLRNSIAEYGQLSQ